MASEKYQVKVNEADYDVEVAQNGAEIKLYGVPVEGPKRTSS